jgi:protein-tyrosine kinase
VARVSEAKPTSGARLKLAQMMLEDPEVADAYQEVFGHLQLAPELAAGNSILVTSTAPDEGKTTVSLCLAVTASCAGQTALLIDGDLRRSSLTASIGGDENVGLIEVLLGQAKAGEAIRHAAIEAPKTAELSFMCAGRKPPLSLGAVDWSQARPAFKSISQEFGLVFLDSPPVLAANDALLFAGMVDAILLVVRAGSANLDEIKRAKELLESIGTPIIGAVLNRFKPKLHGPSNRPYAGYYRRSRT